MKRGRKGRKLGVSVDQCEYESRKCAERASVYTRHSQKVWTRINDDDSYTLYITVFIGQDDFTLCESSNAKTEKSMSQMGHDEEDFNIKECITSFVICSCSFYTEYLVKNSCCLCLPVSLCICGVD